MIRLVLLTLVAVPVAQAQTPLVVQLTPPPPNQLRASDLYTLTVVNPGREAVQAYFRGYIEGRPGGRLAEGRSGAATIRPGTNTLRAVNLDPVDITVTTTDERYRTAFLRTGEAPSGLYRICITAYAPGTNAALGEACLDHEIEQINPPELTSPSNGERLEPLVPPVFAWTPPAPALLRATYRLRVVEVLRGQTTVVAVRTNPAVFELGNLTSLAFPYPTSARRLTPGSTYAWTVAVTRAGETAPLATSRVYTFSVPDPVVRSGDGPVVVTTPSPVTGRPSPATSPVLVVTVAQISQMVLSPCGPGATPLPGGTTPPAPTVVRPYTPPLWQTVPGTMTLPGNMTLPGGTVAPGARTSPAPTPLPRRRGNE